MKSEEKFDFKLSWGELSWVELVRYDVLMRSGSLGGKEHLIEDDNNYTDNSWKSDDDPKNNEDDSDDDDYNDGDDDIYDVGHSAIQ